MRVFSEIQRFDQWWMRLIYFGMVVLLLYMPYTWYISKESVDKLATDDVMGQLITIGTLVPVLILFYLLKLKTEIDEIGIYYQFQPFHFSRQTIRWTEMESCYVRKYRPIKEYGGWGYRTSFGRKGKAYNVKGNIGIQVILKNERKILIGTQKKADANQVIHRYSNKIS